jgi:hypothetical protein
MNRRAWLRRTAVASAGVAAAGTLGTLGHIWVIRGTDAEGLTPAGRDILGHMTRGVLAAFLAAHVAQRDVILKQSVACIEKAVEGLPQLLKLQLGGLLAAMDSPASRGLLAGVTEPWAQLSDTEVAGALDRMRLAADLPTLVAYKALRSLVCLTVFSDRHLQAMTPYPGPMDI